MPILRVNSEDGLREIPFIPGPSLRDILAAGGIAVRSGCGGAGACGRCLVRIEVATVPPTPRELLRLRPEQISQGLRLACQISPDRDLTLTIASFPLVTGWRSLSADDFAPSPAPLPAGPEPESGTPLGVAVDLGTTHISLTLWDLTKGLRLAGRSGANPQAFFGSDVMTRLMAACAARETAAQISLLAQDAIGTALGEMARAAGRRPAEIGRIVIVGNSAMLALLTRKNYELLLDPAWWTRTIDCRPEEAKSWLTAWGVDADNSVEVVQPLAGFVGSDLLAGTLATGLTQGPPGSLLIDFGTNSELALWDGASVWVTSAAGGPAFEGCGISCGMPAEAGAIWRVAAQAAPPGFSCAVIGGGQAEGICGSGLVDIMALLLKKGFLKSNGRFSPQIGAQGFMVVENSQQISVSSRDIDAFQRAKAAIGAAIEVLLDRAGMAFDELQRISVCGAFGRYLDLQSAQETGLLPVIPSGKIKLCGNTALGGCEQILLSPAGPAVLEPLRNRSRTINLSLLPGFEDLFMNNLYLQPMSSTKVVPTTACAK